MQLMLDVEEGLTFGGQLNLNHAREKYPLIDIMDTLRESQRYF